MVNLKLDREGGGDRAPGDHRGAPLAHREQPLEHPVRADVGGALPEPSLPHPHHRLDARDGQAVARGRAGLLQALLCAQQRHRRRRRRRHRRRGEGAGRGHLRHASAQPRASSRACGRRSRRIAPPRRVELKDPRAGNASVRRFYLAPSHPNAGGGRGRGALSAHEDRRSTAPPAGSTRRWCRRRSSPPAPAAGTRATASTAAPSASTRWRPRASASTRSRQASTGSCTSCARRASPQTSSSAPRRPFIADFIYESDSQSSLARRYGEGMLLGLTIEQINDWPAAIAKVTRRGREARRRQVPRHPPLGHRQADPGGAGAGEPAPPQSRSSDKS